MQKISTFQLLTAGGVLLAVLILSGCAEKIVDLNNTEGITVAIDLKSLSPGMAAAIDHFTLLVEARDLISREYPMTRVGNAIIAQLEIPIGYGRRFVARAFDSANVVLYRGETTANILTRTADVTINLYPAVPMINVTPHYQRILMDSAFYVDVSVHNIPNLASISFEFGHNFAPAYIDTITKNPGLGADVYLNYGPGNVAPSVYISLGLLDQIGPIVDASGNAGLVTIAFGSYADWQADTATVSMYIRPSMLWNVSGDTIPLGSIYVDGAITELSRTPDTVQLPTWETTIGGTGSEGGYSVVEAADGGFVVVGTATSAVAGTADIYMAKTDKFGGVTWSKTFGGSADDSGFCIQATPDGYIIAGGTQSFGQGLSDVYLIKTDLLGSAQWAKTYGGVEWEEGRSVIRTADGGYLVTGTARFSMNEIYVVRTDAAGTEIRSHYFGANSGMSIAGADGGAFTIAGGVLTVDSSDNVYLVKADSLGRTLWQRNYGGIYRDVAHCVAAAPDGGSIVVGYSESFGAGLSDVYVLKMTSLGFLSWAKTYGGSGIEIGNSINPTADGGYIMVGTSGASDAFNTDLYVIKVGTTGNLAWDRRFGVGSQAVGRDVKQTSDGGYIIAGTKAIIGAPGDIYLIKTDAVGLVNPASLTPVSPSFVFYK